MLSFLLSMSKDAKSQINKTLNTWSFIPYNDGTYGYQLHVEGECENKEEERELDVIFSYQSSENMFHLTMAKGMLIINPSPGAGGSSLNMMIEGGKIEKVKFYAIKGRSYFLLGLSTRRIFTALNNHETIYFLMNHRSEIYNFKLNHFNLQIKVV